MTAGESSKERGSLRRCSMIPAEPACMVRSLLDPCSIVRVQTWDSQAAGSSKVEQALGIAWPRETGASVSGRVDIICTGPTDWLVIASDLDGAELLQRLDQAFMGS